MNNTVMQFLSGVLKEIVFGVIITWCTVFAGFGQGVQQSDIVDANSKVAVFNQEGVALPNDESAPAFTPDSKTVYFANGQTICLSKMVNGKWGKPVIAPFSGHWKDWDPTLRPDGNRLIFVSTRPLAGMPQDKAQKDAHLWYVDRISGDEWSAPQHFDAPVNIEGANDYGPSVSSAGAICFCSRNRDGNKGMCGYYTKWLGDHFDKPKLLMLNGTSDVFDPFIAPDERYIVFGSDGGLYISYRRGDDWTPGQKLNALVNNGNFTGDPYVSPDGKTLYYSQDKAPGIMMVPVKIPKNIN
jgi:Tol biopolymer transport system component